MTTARTKRSAGLLVWRRADASLEIEVLLVHPGGPFWASKDAGAWSIPKGEHAEGDDPELTAVREFAEELGSAAPPGPRHDLGEVRQKAGKVVRVFALEGDLDESAIASNTFDLEWPPRSGRTVAFPEVDRAGWFRLGEAREKLNAGQVPLLDRLLDLVIPPPH